MPDTEIIKAINGAFGRDRFVQQSPILPDVWLDYYTQFEALRPPTPRRRGKSKPTQPLSPDEVRLDLIVTTTSGVEPGLVSKALREGLKILGSSSEVAMIAHNRATVVARLTLKELVCIVVPMTRWWHDLPKDVKSRAADLLNRADEEPFKSSSEVEFFAFATTVGLLGLVSTSQTNVRVLAMEMNTARSITDKLKPLLRKYLELARDFEFPSGKPEGSVARVQLNRTAQLSVYESRNTIKADACYNLFQASASNIRWGVLDCGVDAQHPAFNVSYDKTSLAFQSRVSKTYDFTNVRQLLSGTATADAAGGPLAPEIVQMLKTRQQEGRPVDWSLVAQGVTIPYEMDKYQVPKADHGTHVAGIIGANWKEHGDPNGKKIIGVCPDIELVDFRVFDSNNNADEFSVVSALQFVGYLNRVSDVLQIHGINISFSFAHDVRNYACGQTPICVECEKLVDNGVVVVAAAGNAGFQQYGQTYSLADRYAVMTITDPGNAPSVITVGSTHRTQPHTYGVSFFSSRGPTGDGRAKPDLVAPGEKILSTTVNCQSGEKDGTSMSAPHVSGAAAILLARSAELIGKPREVKDILCRSATDLGRERSFQGAGLVDVLRALQSI